MLGLYRRTALPPYRPSFSWVGGADVQLATSAPVGSWMEVEDDLCDILGSENALGIGLSMD